MMMMVMILMIMVMMLMVVMIMMGKDRKNNSFKKGNSLMSLLIYVFLKLFALPRELEESFLIMLLPRLFLVGSDGFLVEVLTLPALGDV